MLVVISILTSLFFIFITVAFIRNHWVYKQRGKLIDKTHDDCLEYIKTNAGKITSQSVYDFWNEKFHNAYLSFDEMCKTRYWHIWDVEKLRKKEEEWPEIFEEK